MSSLLWSIASSRASISSFSTLSQAVRGKLALQAPPDNILLNQGLAFARLKALPSYLIFPF